MYGVLASDWGSEAAMGQEAKVGKKVALRRVPAVWNILKIK